MSPGRRLGKRELNRALLARQLLTGHAGSTALDAVAHLVGLQAQKPDDPHIALWSRLRDTRPATLDALVDRHAVVRVAAQRSTIHLLTADDALRIRPAIQPALDRELAGQKVFRSLDGLDLAAVAARGRQLCAQRPLTFAQLGGALAEEFPATPHALAIAVRNHESLAQLPPRGRWRTTGPLVHAPLDVVLGRPEVPGASLADLVPRYLRAFGPATAADIATWSGVTGVRAVLDGLADGLVRYTDERGRTLVDVPDGLLPNADLEAPVLLLPEYDNALLSHADRTRIVADDVRQSALGRIPDGTGSVLVDGFVAALWTSRRDRSSETVTVRPMVALSTRQRRAIEAEALALLAFGAPDAAHRVLFED